MELKDVRRVADVEIWDKKLYDRMYRDISHLSSGWGAVDYVFFGTPTGDFLRCLFSNDLIGVFSHADTTNRANIELWSSWIFNNTPSDCWGSAQIYSDWIHRGGLIGIFKEEQSDE